MLQVSTYKEWYKGSVYLYDTVDTFIIEAMLVFDFFLQSGAWVKVKENTRALFYVVLVYMNDKG